MILKIMRKYGNVVDSMIATMVCDGVVTMNNMGIGGGFVATIYKASERKAYTINARETAPAAASRYMYYNDSVSSAMGGKSVAVPGELRGYWEMYKRFGGDAPWKELFIDTIRLIKRGAPINKHVAFNIKQNEAVIRANPGLHQLLLKEGTNELVREGDVVRNLQLAETLTLIKDLGPDVIYNGTLTHRLVQDIREARGIITEDDLAQYRVKWAKADPEVIANKYMLYTTPAPSSGPILAFIMKAVTRWGQSKGYDQDKEDVSAITEAFKFAYAQRALLGDPQFTKVDEVLLKLKNEVFLSRVVRMLGQPHTSTDPSYYEYAGDYRADHGTANIVAVGPNGDAVAATSTINLIFGSKLVSKSTGIILNDQMDDFSSPGIVNYFGVQPAENNAIQPGARPVSSMCPTIFTDRETGRVRLVVGGAGGTRITTATALVSLRNLFFKRDLIEAINIPRYHHQLQDMFWAYERHMSQDIIDDMVDRGHNISELARYNSAVTAISVVGNDILGSSDYRRLGNVSYYYPRKPLSGYY
ncbi:unnamed protein product [Nesidiocoris tenuis]|uniref:Gamma-glutamyltransferase n=1 Tax=Nesidiocoris tenuis TaxID=355587 RepID=A0A6H5GCW4_9HEMI|nr:unnamed protein product [Nesidiocoris tenuis]